MRTAITRMQSLTPKPLTRFSPSAFKTDGPTRRIARYAIGRSRFGKQQDARRPVNVPAKATFSQTTLSLAPRNADTARVVRWWTIKGQSRRWRYQQAVAWTRFATDRPRASSSRGCGKSASTADEHFRLVEKIQALSNLFSLSRIHKLVQNRSHSACNRDLGNWIYNFG